MPFQVILHQLEPAVVDVPALVVPDDHPRCVRVVGATAGDFLQAVSKRVGISVENLKLSMDSSPLNIIKNMDPHQAEPCAARVCC